MAVKKPGRVSRSLRSALRIAEWLVEHVGTMWYREMYKRNTLRPLQKIIKEDNPDIQQLLLSEWAAGKKNECAYISVAAGLLLTTVASSLTWKSVQEGHWSASALMYSSILISLVGVVSASQQSLVLPNAMPASRTLTLEIDQLPHPVLARETSMRAEDEVEEAGRSHLIAIITRLQSDHRANGLPNPILAFALQAPFMLLAFAVFTFVGGICSAVFAPLVYSQGWDENGKTALGFGVITVVCIGVFWCCSIVIHWLFSLRPSEQRHTQTI